MMNSYEQNTEPLVSVVVPAYNSAKFIRKTIESIQAQTVTNWELFVIDDCSTDETAEIVEEMAKKDPRITLCVNEMNSGVAETRNRGLDLCRGAYVALLDSDDLWYPEKLELQLACFRDTDADIVYTSYAIVDGNGEKQCKDFIVPERTDFEAMLKKNVISCSAVMLSKSVASEYRFQKSFFHEDYALWLQMLRSGCKAVGVTEVLGEYFVHPDSKAGNKLKSAGKRWQIYRKYLGFSVIKSAGYFAAYALEGMRKYRKQIMSKRTST